MALRCENRHCRVHQILVTCITPHTDSLGYLVLEGPRGPKEGHRGGRVAIPHPATPVPPPPLNCQQGDRGG
jgi:hypothetical protein